MRFILLICLSFICCLVLYAQPGPVFDYDKLVLDLKEKLKNGDKKAFRDLASLSDKRGQEIRGILSEYSYFSPSELDIPHADKSSLLNFYYDNADQFKYSEMIGGFYKTPIEEQKINFQLRETSTYDTLEQNKLSQFISQFDSLLAGNADFKPLRDLADSISATHLPEAFQFIRNILLDPVLRQANLTNQKDLYQALCWDLIDDPSTETVKAILSAVDHQLLQPQYAAPVLVFITGMLPEGNEEWSKLTDYYRKQLDSLGSVEALRIKGYQSVFSFQYNYFDYPVDYYGKVLLHSDSSRVALNAVRDMVNTHHPRALFYLAAQIYRYRLQDPRKQRMLLKLLEKITGIDAGAPDEKGNIAFICDNLPDASSTLLKNHMRYWASHSDDYEWDDGKQRFVNKETALSEKENYERLIRRLNTQNDSLAFNAYLQLTEGSPAEIMQIVEKYRPLLRNVNRQVPDFKYKYIDQLVNLTAWCKRNSLSYHPDPTLQKSLNALHQDISPSKRYQLENEIIRRVSLKDLSAIEYNALVLSMDINYSYSAARILDYAYSKFWNEIISDEKQFRTYLKKSILFSNIGVSGVCNDYIKKINTKDTRIREQLRNIARTETDPDILQQINLLLQANDVLQADISRGSEATPLLSSVQKNNIELDSTTYSNLLSKLQQAGKPNVDEINKLLNTPFCTGETRKILLGLFSKISPVTELRKINPVAPLYASRDLIYFKDISFTYKDLEDLPRLFKIDDENAMLQFIEDHITEYSVDETGILFNNLFRKNWFSILVNDDRLSFEWREKIKNHLLRYLNESELLSEFEEQSTTLHMIELDNIGKSLEDKLQASLQPELDEASRLLIQKEIISQICFADIGTVLQYADQLSTPPGKWVYAFLNEDFGIPVFQLNPAQVRELLDLHARLSEYDFYRHYLSAFGINLYNPDKTLNYQVIHDILKYDVVIPFAGNGGNRRDFYVYGVIKILEFTFKTKLGFHEKLNENQTFYTYTSSRRSAAWLDYLNAQQLFKEDASIAPSFNQ